MWKILHFQLYIYVCSRSLYLFPDISYTHIYYQHKRRLVETNVPEHIN